MKRGFTLIEMVVVVMIIGILSGIGLPLYLKARRNTFDKDAKATLKIIKAAEKMKEFETSRYVACSNTSVCRQALRLDLPRESVWDFSVILTDDFCAKAVGNKGTSNWHIDLDMEEPAPGDVCN
jgi:prepilin-type N-terminal cleavage/methylation domain-containing protein